MTRARVSVVGAALLGVWMAASTGLADRGQSPASSPAAARRRSARRGRAGPSVESRRRPGAGRLACDLAGAVGPRAERPGQDLLRHLPQRARQGWRPVAGRLRRDEGARAAGRRREDDPQAERRADAAPGRQAPRGHGARLAHHGARRPHGRVRRGQPQSRPAHVPAPQPSGVRAGHRRPARPRRRRRHLAAARPEERQLRQHRRRAGSVADAARGLPERRRRHQPDGRRRPAGRPRRRHLHQPQLRLAASVGPRRGRALRHARRHGRQPRLPRRRRVPSSSCWSSRATTRAARTSTCRSTASASP